MPRRGAQLDRKGQRDHESKQKNQTWKNTYAYGDQDAKYNEWLSEPLSFQFDTFH